MLTTAMLLSNSESLSFHEFWQPCWFNVYAYCPWLKAKHALLIVLVWFWCRCVKIDDGCLTENWVETLIQVLRTHAPSPSGRDVSGACIHSCLDARCCNSAPHPLPPRLHPPLASLIHVLLLETPACHPAGFSLFVTLASPFSSIIFDQRLCVCSHLHL